MKISLAWDARMSDGQSGRLGRLTTKGLTSPSFFLSAPTITTITIIAIHHHRPPINRIRDRQPPPGQRLLFAEAESARIFVGGGGEGHNNNNPGYLGTRTGGPSTYSSAHPPGVSPCFSAICRFLSLRAFSQSFSHCIHPSHLRPIFFRRQRFNSYPSTLVCSILRSTINHHALLVVRRCLGSGPDRSGPRSWPIAHELGRLRVA